MPHPNRRLCNETRCLFPMNFADTDRNEIIYDF